MEKYEKIGNVILNYEFYSGKDEYSDGDIENDMLELIKNNDDVLEIISNDSRWPILYHFSPVRYNILEWYDMKKDATVLEIGSGCGAVTGVLCKKAKNVKCIELSKRRSLINAYRNKDYDNLEIMVGNFNDISINEKYDYITLIGVLEYADYYTDSKDSFVDFLKNVSRYLKEDGRLLIAIENKFGLKYWAGFAEDHTGKGFDSIENYVNTDSKVRTFSRNGLEKIVAKAGLEDIQFYYPMPDYKMPTEIYSDECLPTKEDIIFTQKSYDNNRIKLFDENLAYQNIIEEGMFPFFANSFFVDAGFREV